MNLGTSQAGRSTCRPPCAQAWGSRTRNQVTRALAKAPVPHGNQLTGAWERSIPSHSANEAKTPYGKHWIQLGSSKNILEQSGTVLVSLTMKPRLEQAKKPVKWRKEPLVLAPHSCMLSDREEAGDRKF